MTNANKLSGRPLLTRESMTGPWAGVPVAWTDDDRFDEPTYREDVARCCRAGIPGVYTGGTTGEFYAMEFDEFKEVARATVEVCRSYSVPAMIGCTATYTLGARRRAEYAARIGADAIQVALPFWMQVDAPRIPLFFRDVAEASGGMPLSVYETTRAKRTLTYEEHCQIRDVVPSYVMVKANADTLGASKDGCQALSEFVNVFVGESQWTELVPHGARGACSAMVYWNPRVVLSFWRALQQSDPQVIESYNRRVSDLHTFLDTEFGPRGFTDTAYDRLGGLASGFLTTSLHCRAPYVSANADDLQCLRRWYQDHFPEMLNCDKVYGEHDTV